MTEMKETMLGFLSKAAVYPGILNEYQFVKILRMENLIKIGFLVQTYPKLLRKILFFIFFKAYVSCKGLCFMFC